MSFGVPAGPLLAAAARPAQAQVWHWFAACPCAMECAVETHGATPPIAGAEPRQQAAPATPVQPAAAAASAVSAEVAEESLESFTCPITQVGLDAVLLSVGSGSSDQRIQRSMQLPCLLLC